MSSIFDGIGDEGVEQLDENLRKWFKEKWVRFGPDGKIRGACARGDDSEGKPKCLPQKKAHALGKKGRKYAASKKRREDPNPERRGKAKNVATKKKSNEDIQVNEKWSQKYKDSINCSNPKGFSQKAHCAGKRKNEDMNREKCPECGGPMYHESMMNEKKDACYHKVRSRYKVWPSAYASGALVQCRKKGAKNWGTGGKKNESNIMKGIVDESENVLVLYIDGKPSTKYAKDHEAKGDLERLQAKFPNKKFELKREMREGVIIGHDKDDPQVAVLGGAGSYSLSNLKKKAQMEANELAKDVSEGKFKNSAYNVKQLANTLNTIVAAEEEMSKLYFGEAAGEDTREIGSQLEDLAYEIKELADTAMRLVRGTEEEGRAKSYWYPHIVMAVSEDHSYMGKNMFTMMDSANSLMNNEENEFNEDYTGEFAAEVTPAINPYGGLKDRKHRGAISETPTDNPTGASGEGGWRKYKPKSAGTIKEGSDELEAFLAQYPEARDAMRNAVRHFEYAYDAMDHVAGHVLHKMPYSEWEKVRQDFINYFVKHGLKADVNEEQLDEKCWDTHKQVGMKKKGDKMVPNCVPKESAIMRGLKRESK
jgi:hypothetical protein